MEAPLFSTAGEAKGNVNLPDALFAQPGSRRVLQEILIAYQANQRRGTSNTKTRSDVSGGGRKPWRQKGTGNARSGSNRSPLWRKGGIAFGPHPRSYHIDIDGIKKRTALATALIERATAQDVVIIEALPDSKGKTGAIGAFLAKAAPSGRLLLVVDKRNEMFGRAVRNINRVRIIDTQELNSWDLMTAQKILLTQAALKQLESRLPQDKPVSARRVAGRSPKN